MTRRHVQYIAEELAWIEANKALPRAVLHSGLCFRFGRRDVTLGHLVGLCKRKGRLTGRTGYLPGAVPANKGKKMPFHPNSARTQFKKGNLPHNTKQLGHERLTVDGYVEISVGEVNPHTGYERRYVHKHRHLWEAANGAVPEGMRLKSLDGDRANTDPANWVAIPKALGPRLNGKFGRGYDAAPAEIKPVIMAICELEHKVRLSRKAGVAA